MLALKLLAVEPRSTREAKYARKAGGEGKLFARTFEATSSLLAHLRRFSLVFRYTRAMIHEEIHRPRNCSLTP